MEMRQAVRIAIYVFDGITAFHLATPLLTFGEVGKVAQEEPWTTSVWSIDGKSVRTAEGLLVDEVNGPEAIDRADIILFPSWPAELPAAPSELQDLIRRAHSDGTFVVGLCLGAFPVAGSGIVDGRAVATHWAASRAMAEQYTAVEVRDEALYIDHGDVLTSAGTASALDACLHIVRERRGAAVASVIARSLVIAPHRDGHQAQYIERPLPENQEGPIGATIAWALAHLDLRLSVEDLAEHARMSARNFSRRFREHTGASPAQWVLARRLDEGRRLLESTELSIAEVAPLCGFASPVTFRQNFLARYATTPTSYRNRFANSGHVA